MDYGIIGGADGPTAILVAGRIGGWNPINWFGLISVLLILLPNLIFAVKCRGQKNLCTDKLLNILEQVGRYGSMLFMVVYVGTQDGFGFGSVFGFLAYGIGNICLILSYWCVWGAYFKATGIFRKKKSGEASAVFLAGEEQVKRIAGVKYALAILPGILFLLDGVTLVHIPLIICALLFLIGHIAVTHQNVIKSMNGGERGTSDDI